MKHVEREERYVPILIELPFDAEVCGELPLQPFDLIFARSQFATRSDVVR